MRVAHVPHSVDIVDACAVVAVDYRVQGKARFVESCLEVPHKPVFEAVHQRIDRPTLL
jgi:hypothetical protein